LEFPWLNTSRADQACNIARASAAANGAAKVLAESASAGQVTAERAVPAVSLLVPTYAALAVAVGVHVVPVALGRQAFLPVPSV
jgi:hypothetical protein